MVLALCMAGCETVDVNDSGSSARSPLIKSNTQLAQSIRRNEVFAEYFFPEKIGTYELMKTRVYEDSYPGGGVSASYHSEGQGIITLFFYDKMEESIDSGVDSEIVQTEAKREADSLKLAGHTTISEPAKTMVGNHPFMTAGAFGVSEGQQLLDLVYVTGLRNAIFKVRFSITAPSRESCTSALEFVLVDLNSRVIEPNLSAANASGDALVITAIQSDYYSRAFSSSASFSAEKIAGFEMRHYQEPGNLEALQMLAEGYFDSTERVWAIVYGEALLNHTQDEEAFSRISKNIYRAYVEGFKRLDETRMSCSLARTAVIDPENITSPFEINFEISALIGLGAVFDEIDIATIQRMRAGQLDAWNPKLPTHTLTDYWNELRDSGHLEAYCYWLFQFANPDEFAKWIKDNQVSFDAFQAYRAHKSSNLLTKELNRLHQTPQVLE